MTLDRTFAKEIKALSDGSREGKFALLHKIDAAVKELSVTNIRDTFNDCIKHHGRAVVGLCVAQTIISRNERIHSANMPWALAVAELLLGNFTQSNRDRAVIDDGIHPTAIDAYAESFIRLTSC